MTDSSTPYADAWDALFGLADQRGRHVLGNVWVYAEDEVLDSTSNQADDSREAIARHALETLVSRAGEVSHRHIPISVRE